jgi:uncharacterized protein (TIGR03067 family)
MTDLELLQGTWEQVGLEVDGALDPPDAHSGPGVLSTFTATTFSVRAPDGTLLLAGAFEIDESTYTITWIDSFGEDAGKRLPALYRIDAARFEFVAGNAGSPRPTTFTTSLGQTKRTFVRRTDI